MSAASEGQGEEPSLPTAETAPGQATAARWPVRHSVRGVAGPIRALERSQDILTVFVGIALILLAAVLLVSGVIDFVQEVSGSTAMSSAAALLLDRVLLVLILVEIVHTVVLSLRAHRLIAQPFIVVGLVAVIRRILFVLSLSNQARVGTTELALLIAMVVVFVAGLIAVSRFEEREP